MADAYRSIASIQKTHGRKGEVVVVPTHGLPFLLRAGLEVALVPPVLKGSRWHTVVSCQEGPRGQLVSFSGVTSIDHAAKLVGKTVLARTVDLPDDYVLQDADALMGREVRDVAWGLLGSICEVMVGPAHNVWVVQGPYGEVMVPVVEAVVRSWDENAPIEVELPPGLVNGPSRGRQPMEGSDKA